MTGQSQGSSYRPATALSARTTMAVQSKALLSRAARHRMSGGTAADHALAFGAAPMRVASA
jgi:hypothetical protein